MDDHKLARQRVLLDLFLQLPTDFLLCSVRLCCREWKAAIESESAEREIWLKRANSSQSVALDVSKKCMFQQVIFESHVDAEQKHNTKFSSLDKTLFYYTRILLWLLQKKICCSWAAYFYRDSSDMHRYWYHKYERARKLGETFNEIDTALALKTVEESRQAALDIALSQFLSIPFTPPI